MKHLFVCMYVLLCFGWVMGEVIGEDVSEDRTVGDKRIFGTGNPGTFGIGGTTGTGGVTVSIGNLNYIILGAAILVPLIIGLTMIFYVIGGADGYGGFRRTDYLYRKFREE